MATFLSVYQCANHPVLIQRGSVICKNTFNIQGSSEIMEDVETKSEKQSEENRTEI